MRSRRPHPSHCHRWTLLIVLIALTTPAWATVHAPEVLIRPELPPRGLVTGQEFEIPVDVYVAVDKGVPVVAFRADAAGARLGLEPALARSRAAAPGGYLHERHVLRGVLEAGLDRIRLQVTVDGETWEESLSLRTLGDLDVDDLPVEMTRDIEIERVDPSLGADIESVASGFATPDPSLQRRVPRSVTTTGRVLMRPNDTPPTRAVEGATVYFMQVRGVLDDLELGRTTTDVNGDFTITASMDGTHDVYVKVRALNDVVNIGTDAGFQTYGRNVRRTEDFSGTLFDAGNIRFTDDMNHALFLTTIYTRMHQWFDDMGFDLPQVNCRWPDDILGSSVYLPVLELEGIHLRSDATWSADTIVHEYGHHFMAASPLREVWPPYYLNGICDPSHCGPCPENEAVAWSEGVPHFLQQEFNDFHQTAFGFRLPGARRFETIGICAQTGILGQSPDKTEEWLAAFLNDLIDTRPDEQLRPGVEERAEFTMEDVLTAAASSRAANSEDFAQAFVDYVAANPDYDARDLQEVWAAGAVNGQLFDGTPPWPPSQIQVPTHPLLTPAPATRPRMIFIGASDADSGLEGFRVSIDSVAQRPGAGSRFTTQTDYTWPESLSDGLHVINVVSVDRVGNESSNVVSRTIEVGDALPIDLSVFRPGLWEDYFLVRNDASVTASSGAIDSDLPPGADVWVSLTSANSSPGGAVIVPFSNRIYLNGSLLTGTLFNDTFMSGSEQYQTLNAGPYALPGGRHHFGIVLDQEQQNLEDDEDDNFVDRYVVVRPPALSAGSWQIFPEPPRAFTSVGPDTQQWPNVSGHRVTPANKFVGVMMATADARTEYSLRAYLPATDWQTGFDTFLATSDSRSGEIEAIVINRAPLLATFFDFGVERVETGTLTNYSMRHVASQTMAPGTDVTVNWTDQDDMGLIEYTFGAGDTGPFSVRVRPDFEPTDPFDIIDLYWMTPSDPVLVPLATDPDASASDGETAALEVTVPSAGSYCLVVHRVTPLTGSSPKAEDGLERSVPGAVSIEIESDVAGLPDLAVYTGDPLWELPFVPSFESQDGPELTMPEELGTQGAPTYINYYLQNLGQTTVADVSVNFYLDAVGGSPFFEDDGQGGDEIPFKGIAPVYGASSVTIPGGRHTLVLEIDPDDAIAEVDETNNSLAVQFGWEGQSLQPDMPVSVGPPPLPEAGRELVRIFTTPTGTGGDQPVDLPVNEWHVNSDGYRVLPYLPPIFPGLEGQWRAIATMPASEADDVDLRLHADLPPVRAFGPHLAHSGFDAGESDFVLVDLLSTESGPYDVSVTNEGAQTGYTIVDVRAEPLAYGGVEFAEFGPYGLGGGQFLELYDVMLPAGSYTIELDPGQDGGFADLGLSVFPPAPALDEPWFSKDQGNDRFPMSYDAGVNDKETVFFEVQDGQEGRYAIVVWKVGAADMSVTQNFVVRLLRQPMAAPCIAIDGSMEPDYGGALAVQTTQTVAGNADLGQVDMANGSELDQLFAEICNDVLHVGLAGNLASDLTDLELFIDTGPGGQNRLRGDNGDFGGLPNPNRMGDDSSGNGFTFEAGFAPDWWFGVQGGDGQFVSGLPYRLFAYQSDLPTAFGGTPRLLGATLAGSNGILSGQGSSNPEGVRVAIDNSNVAGVDAGTAGASGAGVTTGVEWSIPLSAIGDPVDCIRLVAFVNGREHDAVTNQFLPPVPVGTGGLGDPRDLDLGSIAGTQYAIVCPGTSTGVDDPIPNPAPHGLVLRPAAPNPFNPRTTLSFELPRASQVELTIFDLAGRRVRSLLPARSMDAGSHSIAWEGRDDDGRAVSSGAYLARLVADGEQRVTRLALLK